MSGGAPAATLWSVLVSARSVPGWRLSRPGWYQRWSSAVPSGPQGARRACGLRCKVCRQHATTALLPPAEGPMDSLVTVRPASRLAAASARDPAFF